MAQRLQACEREAIGALLGVGCSRAEIARHLGRCPLTVGREIKRNSTVSGYDAKAAQAAADTRACRPKTPRLVVDVVLAEAVRERLEQRWSPAAIAADLRVWGQRVCAETIYRACYNSSTGGLLAGCWRLLPRQRRRRKPRRRGEATKHGVLGAYRPVSDRPAQADQRTEAGHWEGDLIIGKANQTAVATLVERVSRHTLVVGLPNGYDATSLATAVTNALAAEPADMVKTLTWDQGREMTHWQHIENALNIQIYFCEPRSPSQRPSNEQTNGLLRRWLPKGTVLPHNPVHLALIGDNLNTMPRKLHNWQNAQTIYNHHNCNHR